MKPLSVILLLLFVSSLQFSCSKQEYLKSESGIKKELQGTWKLIPIPRYDYASDGSKYDHVESWTFSESSVSIINNGLAATSTYSIHTNVSKAEIKLDGVTPEFVSPARVRAINGTWQITQLDDEFLRIANDQDGTTGLTVLEFQKN